jgi:hypothetical protein
MCDDWVLYHELFTYFDMFYNQWHHLAKQNLWNKVHTLIYSILNIPQVRNSVCETCFCICNELYIGVLHPVARTLSLTS